MKLFLLVLCVSLVYTSPNKKPIGLRKQIGSRIVGGNLAFSGQYPFAAAVYVTTPDGNYFCGGSLLTNQDVLTAGQCCYNADLFVVHLGSNNLNDSDVNDPYAVKVSADYYALHPGYNPATLDNDICLIWLREPVEFSDYLKPAQFLAYGELQPFSTATAIGWGQIGDSQPGIVNELRFVAVTALSSEECRIVYGNQITESMVCVDGSFNEGTCIGDTGSALVQTIGHGYPMIVGIASWVSQNGCESIDPSGFTRVFGYLDWIQNVTGRGG